jgi:hypothetical protein
MFYHTSGVYYPVEIVRSNSTPSTSLQDLGPPPPAAIGATAPGWRIDR